MQSIIYEVCQFFLTSNNLFTKKIFYSKKNTCLKYMVNGLHLYSTFTDLMATKALIASHSPINTPTVVSAMQGAIQLVGSSWG